MVTAFPNEDIEHLIKRWKLEVEKDGILKDYNSHQYFIPNNQKRKLRREEHRRKNKAFDKP